MEDKLKPRHDRRWRRSSRSSGRSRTSSWRRRSWRLVGKLAAGIAHEINNPLTSVLTFSNLMLEQCPPGDPRHEKLKLMARETNRARTIVRQLLNFGRETVIKPEKININQPVSEIADSLVAQDAFKGIGLEHEARRRPSRRSMQTPPRSARWS